MPKSTKARVGSADTYGDKARTTTDSSGRIRNASKEKQRVMVGDKGVAKMGKKGSASTESNELRRSRETKESEKRMKSFRESAKYLKNKNVSEKNRKTFEKTFLGS